MQSLAQARVKRVRALELAADGWSYDRIAREVGYSHRGSAHRAVFKALEEREVEDVRKRPLQPGVGDGSNGNPSRGIHVHLHPHRAGAGVGRPLAGDTAPATLLGVVDHGRCRSRWRRTPTAPRRGRASPGPRSPCLIPACSASRGSLPRHGSRGGGPKVAVGVLGELGVHRCLRFQWPRDSSNDAA